MGGNCSESKKTTNIYSLLLLRNVILPQKMLNCLLRIKAVEYLRRIPYALLRTVLLFQEKQLKLRRASNLIPRGILYGCPYFTRREQNNCYTRRVFGAETKGMSKSDAADDFMGEPIPSTLEPKVRHVR